MNEFPITAEVALRMGKAVANVLRSSGPNRNRVLVGKDTRISGYMLETALTSGLVSMGMDVFMVGPAADPGGGAPDQIDGRGGGHHDHRLAQSL